MNTLTNSVQLIGNLGKDVQLIKFESGSKKASFTLATSEGRKNEKGEYVKNTSWHNIVAWGRNAELMAKILTKGAKVAINGTLNYRSYQDNAGMTKYITEILVYDFMRINGEAPKMEMREPTPF
jgi:single-strand DNA-binding protein